uniref:Exostosin GT47 domain-containing protein n=1 Tax=Glossina austeni TaxID=7395 RepID=A0A1A9VDJ7_GLOAU
MHSRNSCGRQGKHFLCINLFCDESTLGSLLAEQSKVKYNQKSMTTYCYFGGYRLKTVPYHHRVSRLDPMLSSSIQNSNDFPGHLINYMLPASAKDGMGPLNEDVVEAALKTRNAFLSVSNAKLRPQGHLGDFPQLPCRMDTCFDFNKCYDEFLVYVYPPEPLNSLGASPPISSNYQKIITAIQESRYYTTDPERACLFVLGIDTLDRDSLSEDYVRNVPSRLARLSYWNNGKNHVIFNLYSGTWPDYVENSLGFDTGEAILAKASMSVQQLRPGFDISIPLFHKQFPLRAGSTGLAVSMNFPLNKKYLLAFKGKRNCVQYDIKIKDYGIQRRFMWKQMDGAVDGFLSRMISRTRVAKNVVGSYVSKENSTKSALDYLPIETTRETKVINMRPSKKFVKFSAFSSNPLAASSYKVTSMNPQKLRQIEREQELIAEGHVNKIEDNNFAVNRSSVNKAARKKEDHTVTVSHENNTIREHTDNWEPIIEPATSHYLSSTFKPSNKALLHTSIVGELPPQPEKIFYSPTQNPNEIKQGNKSIISHFYEVTENVVEETVNQPVAYDRHSPPYDRHSPPYDRRSPTEFLLPTGSDITVTSLHQNTNRHFTQRIFERHKEKLHYTTTERPNYQTMFLDIVRKHSEKSSNVTMNLPLENTPSNLTKNVDLIAVPIKRREREKRRQQPSHYQSSIGIIENGKKIGMQKPSTTNSTFEKTFRNNISKKNNEYDRQRGSVKFNNKVAIEEF